MCKDTRAAIHRRSWRKKHQKAVLAGYSPRPSHRHGHFILLPRSLLTMLRKINQMSGSITRHDVMVRGRPTEVLCVGQSLQETPEDLVLFIPGTLGLVSYYTNTMQTLYARLGGSHAVWTVSHAGHCLTVPSLWPSWEHVYDLEQQVEHKVAFLEDHLPRGTRVTLIGHSIGCHIILHLLNHFENKDITISRSFLLFPAIERMKASPMGTRLWPVLRYLRWFLVLMVCFVYLVPGKIIDTILQLYLGEEVAPCCVGATREMLHARVAQNMLWMGYNNLLQVVELDLDTVRRHKDKILLYYGATDPWCPKSNWEDLRARVEGVEALLCEEGYYHGFFLYHSKQMAEKLARWIKS